MASKPMANFMHDLCGNAMCNKSGSKWDLHNSNYGLVIYNSHGSELLFISP